MRWAFPLLLLVFLGCGAPQEPEPLPPPPSPGPNPLWVQVNPDGRTIHVGDTLTMSASVLVPQDFGSVSVTWAVSDDEVATVSSEGIVTGLAAGSIGVRATLMNNKGQWTQGVATLHVE